MDSYDAQIDALEEYKESWSDVADDYEKAQERITLAQKLGTEAENNLLTDRITYLEKYRDAYLQTMQEIEDLENKTAAQVVGSTSSSTSSSATTSTSSAPSLTTGSYVSVKSGTKWYANSYGEGSSGTAHGGTIKYINTSGSYAYNIDGLGWVKKSDIVGYANGGEVDYTGLAMLHGSKSRPEYVLNNDQIRNILSNITRPNVSSALSGSTGEVNNYNFGNIELPNVTNAKQFVTELKSLISITRHQ